LPNSESSPSDGARTQVRPFRPKPSTKRVLSILWTLGFFVLAGLEIWLQKTWTIASSAPGITMLIFKFYYDEKSAEREKAERENGSP
jgi:hypothetical protein